MYVFTSVGPSPWKSKTSHSKPSITDGAEKHLPKYASVPGLHQARPASSQHERSPARLPGPLEVIVNQVQNLEELRSSDRASKFRARIASLLCQSLENRDESLVDLSAAKSFTHLLANTNASMRCCRIKILA